jgi:hypothetical protein
MRARLQRVVNSVYIEHVTLAVIDDPCVRHMGVLLLMVGTPFAAADKLKHGVTILEAVERTSQLSLLNRSHGFPQSPPIDRAVDV